MSSVYRESYSNRSLDIIGRSKLCIILDEHNNFKIIKNGYDINRDFLNVDLSMYLIKNIISCSILGNNSPLIIFSAAIQQELICKCKSVFEKYGVKHDRISIKKY